MHVTWVINFQKNHDYFNRWDDMYLIILHRKTSNICSFYICQVIMFNPRVMVTKTSKMAHLYIFCWWKQKISHIMGKCLRAPERSYWVLSENAMVNRLWSYNSWDIKVKDVKKPVESAKKTWKPQFSRFDILLVVV